MGNSSFVLNERGRVKDSEERLAPRMSLAEQLNEANDKEAGTNQMPIPSDELLAKMLSTGEKQRLVTERKGTRKKDYKKY